MQKEVEAGKKHRSDEIQKIEGKTFVSTDSRYVDPFVMSLNHGETFGVFDRQGDVVNLGKKLQGIFFEGSRHLSLLDFQLNSAKPLLLSSVIREDNDSLNVDMSNEEFEEGGQKVRESTIHIKKTASVRNEGFYEKVVFKNFNPFKLSLDCSVHFDADFKDVFELRGFVCQQKPNPVDRRVENGEIVFSHVGRDGIIRSSRVRSEDERVEVDENCLRFCVHLEGGQSDEISFSIKLSREVPREKLHLFEGELERKNLFLGSLKKLMPKIRTSNAHFNHWLNRSTLDLMALMSCYGNNLYPMAGVPWYNTPFGRDGLITAFQTLSVAPFIAKNTLEFLADYQAKEDDPQADAEPGKILHELRKGELANIGALPFRKYYGAVDSTFLFLWLAGLYLKRTGDKNTIEKIWPAIEKALQWSEESPDLDGDGFYEYKKRNPVGLDNQCWKDSWDSISHTDGELANPPLALCEVQGYAYQAFSMATYLYEERGDLEKAKEFKDKAARLKEKFNRDFWMEDAQFFALALDKDKKQCQTLSSNPGHCLATEIMERSKAQAMIERLFSSELFTGWGIRTLGKSEKRYNPMSYHNGSIWPHDNSMIAYGLKKYGQKRQFHQLAKALFETTLEMDLMRLPELFCGFERIENESPTLYPVSCSPQAWATGVVFILMESMLGLKIQTLKKRISFEDPSLPEFLDWIELKGLPLENGQSFSFAIRRAPGDDATVEILERPDDWKISINK